MPRNDHRYWVDRDGRKERIPGVTTVLKQLGWSSGGLMYWAWQVGYDGKTLEEERGKAADVGTVVHAMIEAELKGEETLILDELPAALREQALCSYASWLSWKKRADFRAERVEMSMVSEKLRFGGTIDLVMAFGKMGIMDFKTGKAIYPDHLCQIAAYGKLYEEHCPNQRIEEYHLIRLSRESGAFHHHCWPAVDMEAPWKVFLKARELYDLKKEVEGLL